MDKNIKLLLDKSENLGWSTYTGDGYVTLSKFSPAGQDFSFDVDITNITNFIDDIYKYYESYDVSYETYLWLDDYGHGKNGSPYDMKDLYEDMEACKENIKELYEYFKTIALEW